MTNNTISVKKLLLIMLVILFLVVAAVAVIYYLHSQKAIPKTPEQKPKYLFSIYGPKSDPLKEPMEAVTAGGRIFVANTEGNDVEVFDSRGNYQYSFGQNGNKPGDMAFPYGIAEDDSGHLFVSDTGERRIQEFTVHGKFVQVIASNSGPRDIEKPGPLFWHNAKLYASDLEAGKVLVFNPNQVKTVTSFSNLAYPHGVWVDNNNQLFVSAAGDSDVCIFASNGKLQRSFSWQGGNELSAIRGLAVDNLHRIFVVDSSNSTVRVFNSQGTPLFKFGSPGVGSDNFLNPAGIYIGQDHRIYVADWANNRIQVWGY